MGTAARETTRGEGDLIPTRRVLELIEGIKNDLTQYDTPYVDFCISHLDLLYGRVAAIQAEQATELADAITFPAEPIAKTMADLLTPKQLVAIRAIANAEGLNAEAECMQVLKCRPEELSRRAASAFIDYLKERGNAIRAERDRPAA